MAVENKQIRWVWGILTSLPVVLKNKMIGFNEGDNGSGRDRTQMIAKGPSGTEHIYATKEEIEDYVDNEISTSGVADFESGTYVPTVISESWPLSYEFYEAKYQKQGDIVFVSGSFYGSSPAPNQGQFEISLPFDSIFLNQYDLHGGGISYSGANYDSTLMTAIANTGTVGSCRLLVFTQGAPTSNGNGPIFNYWFSYKINT